ncbi:MAG TPA: hypothetical protein VN667_08655 [Burkholderiales bacterium]|nr:hypothetical protein [Burkholderiales bacterium]
MFIDWIAFAEARREAHQAVQWLARAARANLPAAPDDSHTSLTWDAGRGALLGQLLGDSLRLGVGIAGLELFADEGDALPLAGLDDATAAEWIDALLARRGLQPASAVTLPYEVERASYGKTEPGALIHLARWFSVADSALEALRGRAGNLRPGPGPVRTWPHHFDMATLIALEEGDPETARSIGAGVSMGDGYYDQPYAYISPWPRPDTAKLPTAPRPGHWHTRDFVSLVASADDLLGAGAMDDVLGEFLAESCDVARSVLNR